MSGGGRTWWDKRFMEALSGFTDRGRLERGRSYSSDSRILSCHIDNGVVKAVVRGNINPYFNVYKEPRYRITIRMTALPDKVWKTAIDTIGSKAALVARLLIGEMPDNIETVFNNKHTLLPHNRKDFKETTCSCPDWGDPCKHIVGVYYRLARLIDHEPLLLFELRGMPQDRLHKTLAKTPLGEVLTQAADEAGQAAHSLKPYFAPPQVAQKNPPNDTGFWRGAKPLPTGDLQQSPAPIPAMLIKKGGQYPPFWHKDAGFVELMEELYLRARKNNKMIDV